MASENVATSQHVKFLEDQRGDFSRQKKLGEAEMAFFTHAREMDHMYFQDSLERFKKERDTEAAGDEVIVAVDVQGSIDKKGPFELSTADHRSDEEPPVQEMRVDVPVAHAEFETAQQGEGFFKFVADKVLQSVKILFSGISGFKLYSNKVAKPREDVEV